jgi:UDP-glucose 4-epimerase
MRLLVTGGTGFVGGHLLAHLADRHELFAIARRPPPPDIADGATWIEQDLRRFDPGALPQRVDAIIHLAQSPHYREFPAGAPDVFSVNVASTFGLLEYARAAGARAFVLASTGGLYGYHRRAIREDEDEPRPTTFYFRSKRSAELIAAAYSELLSVIVLRFFFVYGPGQTRMLIPTLIDKVAHGEEVVVEGDPGLRINPIHVEDAVRVFEPALELGGSATFNVAGSEEITISALVRLIGEIAGRTPAIAHTETQRDGDLVADAGRMREVLGVVPHVSLRDGLRSAMATPSSRR